MSLTYDDLDALAADLRAAREEVERLRAQVAELEATLANERGEGEPPEVGWSFLGGEWLHHNATVSPVIATTLAGEVRRRWEWATFDASGQRSTARSAMRAAIAALPSPPETP